MRSWRIAAAGLAGVMGMTLAVAPAALADPADPEVPTLAAALRTVAGLPEPANPAGAPVPARRDKENRVVVYVEGDDAALQPAVAAAGGEVTAAAPGLVRAAVPAADLVPLAQSAGVTAVRPPDPAVALSVTSEGVAASGADAWLTSGRTGAGVKVGIIDVGYAGLSAAQSGGELPAAGPGLVLHTDGCADPGGSRHGTGVAEVVHDMAPDAVLYLSCVDDSLAFAAAADWLRQQGVAIICASIGFPNTGRGDGINEDASPEGVVRRARQAGVLWVNAAGNAAQLHRTGPAADADRDTFVEWSATAETNSVNVAAGGVVTVALKWDAWPRTNQDLDLYIMDGPFLPSGTGDPHIVASSRANQKGTTGGLAPTEQVTFTNLTAASRLFYLVLKTNSGSATTRYDLSVLGDISGELNVLQYSSVAGSVVEPATSPYALAVGASNVNSNVISSYSSQGPTIDGRVKPDVTGPDQVSTFTYGAGEFRGTSVAAAHVAGAAALLKGANPALDAGNLEYLLRDQASPRRFDSQFGYGTLALGAARTPAAPHGDPFTPVSPTRVLNTTTALGGHQRTFTAGETFTFVVPGVPADASAVVLNLTGIQASANTYLRVYGDPQRVPTTAGNLQLDNGQATADMVTVGLGPDRAIRIFNARGTVTVLVDLLGYFSPTGASTYFPEVVPQTALDSRTATGGHQRVFNGNEEFALQVRGVLGVPADASAVAVAMICIGAGSDIDVYPQTWSGTSSINCIASQARANMVVTGVGSDGKIRIRNHGTQTAHVLVRILGWFGPGDGSRYVSLPTPVRILDTALGNGVRGAIGQGQIVTLPAGRLNGVPDRATAVMTTVYGYQPTVNTYLTAWRADQPVPAASAVNVEAGRVLAACDATAVSPGGVVAIRNSAGSTRALIDLSGYFTR
ncbi:MAG: hypothetical protein V7603_2162 [Micromonosporaceae bacterium]